MAFISLTEEDGEGPVVAVKDLVDVRGTVTTGGRRAAAAGARPGATRSSSAGCASTACVMIGQDQPARVGVLASPAKNPHHGGVRNTARRPAASRAARRAAPAFAVATGMCDWAIVSDTGGSIRPSPASFCGRGRLQAPRSAPSTLVRRACRSDRTLDTLGPLATDVRTAAAALEMMSGLDRARAGVRLPPALRPARGDGCWAGATGPGATRSPPPGGWH